MGLGKKSSPLRGRGALVAEGTSARRRGAELRVRCGEAQGTDEGPGLVGGTDQQVCGSPTSGDSGSPLTCCFPDPSRTSIYKAGVQESLFNRFLPRIQRQMPNWTLEGPTSS